MRDASFALIFAILLPAAVMSACAGVMVWVWTAMLSPNELLYGFMAGVSMNRIVALVTILVILAGQDRKNAYLDSIVGLVLLFAVAGTISWLASIVPSDDGDTLYQKLLKEVALLLAITAVVSTRHRIHLLVLTVCAGFGFIGVKEGLIFLLTAGGHKVEGVLSIGDNNSLATALLMVVPFMYYLSRYSAVRVVRLGMLAAAGLCLVTVVATYSRGGFVGLLVFGAFMVKNSRNKVTSLVVVAVAGLLIWNLAPESWFARLNTINEADSDSSFMGRVNAWKICTLIALDHPLTGGGLHASQRYLVWNAYKAGVQLFDFIQTPPVEDLPRAAHSSYFEVLGDLGFIGLTVFLGILAAALWQCRSISKMARGRPELAWAADLGRMMQISIVVYAVTTAALSMAYFEFFYILLAMISRTRRTVSETIAAEAGASRSGTPRTGGQGRSVQLPGTPARRPAYAQRVNPG